MRRADPPTESSLRCSFCSKGQNKVGKLISSPTDSPRAYICDQCITVCADIIGDDRTEARTTPAQDTYGGRSLHPLLAHPLASDLIEAIERWIRELSIGNDGLIAMADVRSVATA